MKMSFDQLATDTAVARFHVRVFLDGLVSEYLVKGRVVGPKRPGISTVEIAYPMEVVEAEGKCAKLAGVIPEPNLWTREAPFFYQVCVEVWEEDQCVETQAVNLVLRDRSGD